jgi:THO complex subunit 2
VLHLCDIETSADPDNKRRRDALVHLLSATCETVVSESILRERLELDTAGDAGIVVNKKAAGTKFVKLKTRLYYKQQKFNLLREESEGYAKLITELCQDSEFDVNYMLQVIRSLIGCFNLDPNRVMDILLEVFEVRIRMEKVFVALIREFVDNSTAALTQVLAFRFNFYKVCVAASVGHFKHHCLTSFDHFPVRRRQRLRIHCTFWPPFFRVTS